MAENVKLKDLYADEKVYNGINIVKIPKQMALEMKILLCPLLPCIC